MDGVHNPHDDFVNSQWVEIGMQQHQQHHNHHGQQHQHQQQQQQPAPIHPQQQHHQHHQHHPSHDFGAYGFVESPGFVPQDQQFRLQAPPVPIAPNYLGLSHWGQNMVPPAASHAQFMPSPAIAPPPGSAPLPNSVSAHTTQSTSSPRRTLTDADRRRMCIFHEEHPNVKQTEIGAMFGVERSTVSKVLRQKEKYLFPDDGSRSPVKRSKGKFPDIERALAVWAKNTRKQGVALTDMMIREKAKFFASSVGISDSQFKANSAGWLEKFKHKNNLHANGRGRSESDVTGAGRAASIGLLGSPRQGHARTESTPMFKQEGVGPLGSPLMRESKSTDSNHTESPESYMEFGGFKHQMQTPGSASTATSMSSMFTDTGSSFTGPASPTSPFFSPDARGERLTSPGYPPHVRIPGVQRPRSQTFHGLDSTYISPPPSSEPLTPKMIGQTSLQPSSLASPQDMPHDTPASSHTTISGQSAPQTPMGPPSREDACRALEVVMSFMRQQPVGSMYSDDYVLVGKLLGRIGLDGGPIDENHAGFPGIAP
ncbi:CenpB-DNA-bind-domain-containing protein [Morchella conica CCBAS932]|uniref:CenpB-DNA-bind-domain-containing protein n=1 Tax=Morchella conica CCBAS932 TaxID=1392247 RepID=A0A3N4KY05_9PEZI|nr:CenpB-DNA-bind-domain-containing protein [Morchella conica CCBAS932]